MPAVRTARTEAWSRGPAHTGPPTRTGPAPPRRPRRRPSTPRPAAAPRRHPGRAHRNQPSHVRSPQHPRSHLRAPGRRSTHPVSPGTWDQHPGQGTGRSARNGLTDRSPEPFGTERIDPGGPCVADSRICRNEYFIRSHINARCGILTRSVVRWAIATEPFPYFLWEIGSSDARVIIVADLVRKRAYIEVFKVLAKVPRRGGRGHALAPPGAAGRRSGGRRPGPARPQQG